MVTMKKVWRVTDGPMPLTIYHACEHCISPLIIYHSACWFMTFILCAGIPIFP